MKIIIYDFNAIIYDWIDSSVIIFKMATHFRAHLRQSRMTRPIYLGGGRLIGPTVTLILMYDVFRSPQRVSIAQHINIIKCRIFT